MYIYKITNKINSKIYIGQTTKTIEERFAAHLHPSNKCKHIGRAIKKYGRENFSVQLLQICDNNDSLNYWEKYYIGIYDSVLNGYNICLGGQNGPMIGRKHSEESKRKITAFQKGRKKAPFSADHCKNMSLSKLGKARTFKSAQTREAFCKKLSEDRMREKHHLFGKTGFACKNSKGVFCKELNKIFGSQAEAAKELGLQQGNINKVLNGTRSHTGGYTFSYLED